jgi:histidinol dehydrogenase
MKIGSVADHRSREGGAIIYPVYSRRSGGLSVGINLFPDRKVCSFDCPYCEVFPFSTDIAFNLEIMKAALKSCVIEAKERGVTVRDICFSGNGEPTMSPDFPAALETARSVRDGFVPEAKLVLITNATGLLNEKTFALLKDAALGFALNIWLKFDAGTEDWYKKIDRSDVHHAALMEKIKAFAATGAPFTVQTMVCKVRGELPPAEEERAWLEFAASLARGPQGALPGKGLQKVQIYGKARPAAEDPLCEEAPIEALEERAVKLRVLVPGLLVEVYR